MLKANTKSFLNFFLYKKINGAFKPGFLALFLKKNKTNGLFIFWPVFFILIIGALPLSAEKKMLVIGDSLSEGYGVSEKEAWPFLLEQKFSENNMPIKIINSSISGSTTASAPGRVQWGLKSKPDYLLLALGANDGLRGFKVPTIEQNLTEAIEKVLNSDLEKKPQVILVGIQMPPNYGKQYREDFKNVFVKIAKKYQLLFVPFLLEGVGGEKNLNQSDGIHPNPLGHKIMAENVFKVLKDLK